MSGLIRSLIIVAGLAVCAPTQAAVRLLHGPTPIPNGDAKAAGDLTVVNEKLAFALAVQSSAPYGVPRGALVDLAPVTDGRIDRDRVVFADFIPNNWSAWPNTYQRVTVAKETPDEVVIRAERDWGAVAIETVYSLKSGADQVHVTVTMTNGGKTALTALRSGLTLWPSAGFLFAVPGLDGLEDGSAAGALSDRVTAYDAGWSVTLHAPYLEHVGYGSKDMYQTHSLGPGERHTFEGWLQVTSSGDLAPVVAEETARKALPSGVLAGRVATRGGAPVDQPVVVIEKAGKPYAWTLGRGGRYQIALPAGDYAAYATAKGYAQTAPVPVHVAAAATLAQDFKDLSPPGHLSFTVTAKVGGAPLDARIAIAQGQKPLVQFLGKKAFFTELDRKGRAEVDLAPGDYVFEIAHGADVLAAPRPVKVTVVSGQTQAVAAALDVLFDPAASGWVSADLHHHADQAEAVTPPADLARSQLAAGLDLLFVSDHDSTASHKALQAIADARGIAFIPSVEISTSWAHFNAYPLRLGEPLRIDTSRTTIDEVLAESRRLGASVVQLNHPFIPYGYFASLDAGVAPGGFNPGFDLVEINAANPVDDDKVLAKLAAFWNQGHRYYLTAGTDTHDVWNERSGKVRMMVHLDGRPTAAAFADALKAGHAYVTYGPLIFPDHMFGDTLKARPGEGFSLGFDLKAVDGLKRASLVGRAGAIETRDLTAAGRQTHVAFDLKADTPGWYALTVEDAAGHKAYSDPIWVDVVSYPPTARGP
ncbi:MAG: CehA/McbA family metallohydrolase [Caulobacteraceae bacterium]|nr:CehA/McbA family metallohydrolase [Caulobacteraceae bacterium]